MTDVPHTVVVSPQTYTVVVLEQNTTVSLTPEKISVVAIAQQGPQGPTGPQGVGSPGPAGPEGPRGSQILTGSAVPDNGTQGEDNDLYIRTNGQVYHKQSGVWVLKATFVTA